jgi:hypothetical protein
MQDVEAMRHLADRLDSRAGEAPNPRAQLYSNLVNQLRYAAELTCEQWKIEAPNQLARATDQQRSPAQVFRHPTSGSGEAREALGSDATLDMNGVVTRLTPAPTSGGRAIGARLGLTLFLLGSLIFWCIMVFGFYSLVED